MNRTNGRRRLRRPIAGALLAGALLSLTWSASAAASHDQVTFFDASNELSGQFGASAHTKSLDEMERLGVDVIRYDVYWRLFAPSPDATSPPPGFDPRNPLTYGLAGANWAGLDAVVQGAAARGLAVALVLSGSPPDGKVPRWASRDPNGTQSDPSPGAFGDFAYAVGKRYGGGPGSIGNVRYISVWNEPNSTTFLRGAAGQGPAAIPPLYRQLVTSARTGLTAAGWPGKLLIGELGPTGTSKLRKPLRFMQATLCLNKNYKPVGGCGRLDVAGWAHHPYSFGRAPFLPGLNPEQVSFANLRVLEAGIAKARRAGALSPGARLYVTEFGYPSRPDSPIGVARRLQAEFISLAEYMAYQSPSVASYAQYLMRDDPPGTSASGFTSGLCPHNAPDNASARTGAGCKPAYAAFRTPLVVRARPCRGNKACAKAVFGPVRIWGRVRPATGPTQVTIRFQDPGSPAKVLRTVRTNSAGYFQFRAKTKAGRLWGVSWNGLKGPLVRAYRF
jgi:hypothetical protein